ncbi:MAG: tRNA pseudouridine(55) synthase TruB [Ruminococcaceae bacterium]|nr:tRNA pseudouridine(55) synthase TruB [Oscillospiraceae bacterium]
MNGIIVINKPSDWTSHDVVAKLRGILHERRTGHGGTLDPMATGVLPVFVGRATRAVEFIENADKEYIAGIKLGCTTDTQDITGTVLTTSDVTVTKDDLLAVMPEFTGDISQIPPMYSAIKQNGKKLYELARKGIETERKPRNITIFELELLEFDGNEGKLRIVCSKGTYIRTLCHDIGARLGCGAVMSSLIRTRVGEFRLENAVNLEDVSESKLMAVDSVFANLPECRINAKQEKKCRNGCEFKLDVQDGKYRVYSGDGSFLMLGEVKDGVMKTVKSFFEVN